MRLQVPLRVFSRDGRLIAQIGEYRRIPVSYEDIPQRVQQAFLAAEDDRFFQASRRRLRRPAAGDRRQPDLRAAEPGRRNDHDAAGAQHVPDAGAALRSQAQGDLPVVPDRARIHQARDPDALPQQDFSRAARLRCGSGSGGVFRQVTRPADSGGDRDDCGSAPGALARQSGREAPSAPSCVARTFCGACSKIGQIDRNEFDAAGAAPMESQLHGPIAEVEAPYVAEMARADAFSRLGDDTYTAGFRVFTTIDSRLQEAANSALRLGLIEYDRRHGYRGPIARVPIRPGEPPAELLAALEEHAAINVLQPALVVDVAERAARVVLKDGRSAQIDWPGIAWARAAGDSSVGPGAETCERCTRCRRHRVCHPHRQQRTARAVARGARGTRSGGSTRRCDRGARTAASISSSASSTASCRRAGSRDRLSSPSSIPRRWRTASHPSSIVMDAPVVFEDEAAEDTWRPENSTGEFYGPTRLREALVRSRNLVSVRLMRAMGIGYTMDYLQRFGFRARRAAGRPDAGLGEPAAHASRARRRIRDFRQRRLSRAAVLPGANRGRLRQRAALARRRRWPAADCEIDASQLRLPSWGSAQRRSKLADAIRGGRGELPAAQVAPRAISSQNAYLITDMMRDVIRRGTGPARAGPRAR